MQLESSTARRRTPWLTLLNFTMAEIVLDANVIVALLYADDSLHQRAVYLATRLEGEGHSIVLVDFLVFEALSVLCRRAAQRKTAPPDLAAAVARMRSWFDNGEVRFLAQEFQQIRIGPVQRRHIRHDPLPQFGGSRPLGEVEGNSWFVSFLGRHRHFFFYGRSIHLPNLRTAV